MHGAKARLSGAMATVFMLAVACFLTAQLAYAETGSQTDIAAGTTAGNSAQSADPQEEVPVVYVAPLDDGLYNIASVSKEDYSIAVKDDSTKAKARAMLSETLLTNWSQKWIAVFDSATGYYTLRNLNSRMVLSVAGKVKAGTAVKQMKQTKSLKQRWTLVKSGKSFALQSAANPAYALTVGKAAKDGFALKLAKLKKSGDKAHPKKSQMFKFQAVDAIDDGRSFFVRSAKSGKAVSVPGDSRKNKAKLALEKKKKVRSQKFRFIKSGATKYTIQCVSSCKYVGVKGSALRQYANKGGKDKKWKVALDLNTGTFTFKSALNSKRKLDATSGKLAMKKAKDAKVQRFVLLPTYGFKVYLDAGHNWYNHMFDPGAEGSGRDEADLTRDLVDRIEEQLVDTDIETVNGSQFHLDYWRRNGKATSLGCDVVLSVHFDAGGGNTTATMVGTRGPLSKSKAFNEIIHKALKSSIGLRDGGTMHRSDITVVNGSTPAVLMEVCFIDNYGCLKKYLNRRDSVAESLAQAIVKASKTPSVQR